jgi:arsenite/tail-anchored protein-transporting ATPase
VRFLENPPHFLFFTGKGGVGKTSITTCGFPTAIAGLGWIDDVIAAETERS